MHKICKATDEEMVAELIAGRELLTDKDLLNSNAINDLNGNELPGRRDAKGNLRRFDVDQRKWVDR